MIAIVDYSLGNLYSIGRSLDFLGLESAVTGDPAQIARADRIILPGVGAFGDAMEKLAERNLIAPICGRAAAGVPLMGICLGMQLLFEVGYEYGEHKGLGLLPGEVRPIAPDLPTPLKLPQIGWNALRLRRPGALIPGVQDGDCVYYVHSYYAKCPDDVVVASSEYGVEVPGVVERGNVVGCQFHPEKSGDVGLSMLAAFARMPGGAPC
ncbi:MAG: imidazole glycerol phosphate synthase subunit HisH [Clostridiales bacterium]|nr:imidazole glycerol phosphate synthase subunit HisH [Clostridiales bacterium]